MSVVEMIIYSSMQHLLNSGLRSLFLIPSWNKIAIQLKPGDYVFSCICAFRKKGERLDWMYAAAAGQVDHEMYLLGKPVDKAVDPMAQENEEVGLNSLRFI